jgi:phosphate transport system substrate-binding protein
MRPERLGSLRVIAALAVTAMLGLALVGPAQVAQATTYVPINGQGSSWAAPALDQWSTDMVPQGLHITYNPLGSAAGRQAYIGNHVDFAGSDIAFLFNGNADPFGGTDEFSANLAYSYIPDVAGGTSFMYNIVVGGHRIKNMRLSGRTLTEIFTGQITNWDDPRIAHDYGAHLPSLPITVVTRSDGSGASYMFTRWMWSQYPSLWQPFCRASGGPSNCGPTELYPGQHPGFKSLNGSDLVATYIASSSNNGSIGYDEYAYAINYQLPVVNMLNAAGYYVPPSASNVAIALEKAVINLDPKSPDYLMQENLDAVYTNPDPRAYPLSSYSYLIVPRTSLQFGNQTLHPPSEFSPQKGHTLTTWINYMLCGAQQNAGKLGYSPLPEPMVKGGVLQESKIPGAVQVPSLSNYNRCNNPAYYNGVDVLTATAPYPSPCQKVTAPLYNCVVSKNGQAVLGPGGSGPGGTTPGSGSPSSGPGGKNSLGTNGTTGPGGTRIDPNTGQLLGASGTTNANVNAQPVGLVSQPGEKWLFVVLTTLELLAVVAVPAFLGTWLTRRRKPV